MLRGFRKLLGKQAQFGSQTVFRIQELPGPYLINFATVALVLVRYDRIIAAHLTLQNGFGYCLTIGTLSLMIANVLSPVRNAKRAVHAQ